jgi:hypothetical protein
MLHHINPLALFEGCGSPVHSSDVGYFHSYSESLDEGTKYFIYWIIGVVSQKGFFSF